ncbi:MAG: cupin domain-containing protein [Bacteroidetes bacterium]|nr:cupin domain-containing protein [Bacteroidota bacterium]
MKKIERIKIVIVIVGLMAFQFAGAQEKKKSVNPSEKKFTIENCVNEYSEEKSDVTESGHRFWFVDKEFIDGQTLKLSAVKPYGATHPPHKHVEDEFFFILEGKAKFYLDGKTKVVEAYTSLYCPANVEHGISNAGDTELKYLVIKKYLK